MLSQIYFLKITQLRMPKYKINTMEKINTLKRQCWRKSSSSTPPRSRSSSRPRRGNLIMSTIRQLGFENKQCSGKLILGPQNNKSMLVHFFLYSYLWTVTGFNNQRWSICSWKYFLLCNYLIKINSEIKTNWR